MYVHILDTYKLSYFLWANVDTRSEKKISNASYIHTLDATKTLLECSYSVAVEDINNSIC